MLDKSYKEILSQIEIDTKAVLIAEGITASDAYYYYMKSSLDQMLEKGLLIPVRRGH